LKLVPLAWVHRSLPLIPRTCLLVGSYSTLPYKKREGNSELKSDRERREWPPTQALGLEVSTSALRISLSIINCISPHLYVYRAKRRREEVCA